MSAQEEGSVAAPLSSAEGADSPREQPALPPIRHREGGELGRGGMARVTGGFDPVLERPVALKRSLRGSPEEDAQLLREARLTAQLDHPAIAPVLDVGLDAQGALVCVLHVRQGASFADAVRGAPPGVPAHLLRALLSASQAVAHAHARGVLHRDLSPNNVRLAEDGAVWVLDWGLAATRDEAARGGFRGGTAGSIAPEQRAGGPTSAASDVWSLGALLHLLCARTLPGELVATAPRGCPRPLWAVCQRALAEQPDARYRDARAFADELARWLDGQPLEAWPEGPGDRLLRIAGRRPRLTFALMTAVVLASVAGTVATSMVLRAEEEARGATAALLRESAERALAADDVTLARRLANQALASRDDPRTRGVLATLARVPEVERHQVPGAGCVVLDVAEGGVTCRSADADADAAARFASGAVLTASQASSSATLSRGAALTAPQLSAKPTLSEVTAPPGAALTAPELSAKPTLSEVTAPPGAALTAPEATLSQDTREVAALPGAARTASQASLGETRAVIALPGGTPEIAIDPARRAAVLFVPDGVLPLSDEPLGASVVSSPCTPGQAVRFAVPRERGALVFCADDELVEVSRDAADRRFRVTGLGSVLRGPTAGDLTGAEELIVGTADGHLGVINLAKAELTWAGATGLGLIRTVLASADGHSAALLGDRGAGIFRLAEGHVLPVSDELVGVWRRGAHGFVGARADGSLVELLARERLAVTRGLHGRSALAVHEATRRIAVGDSSGTVQVAHLDEGVQQTVPGAVRVIKSLSFSPDGRFLALGAAGPDGVLVFDTTKTPISPVPGPWDGDAKVRGRHVAFLDATHVVYVGWGGPPRGARFDATQARFVEVVVPALPGDLRDLSARESEFFAVDAARRLHRLSLSADGFHAEALQADDTERVAVSPGGAHRVASHGQRLWRLAPHLTAPRDVAAPLEALAVADDGRVALCRRDGVVELRDEKDRVLLEAPAHEQRCAKVAFCDSERAVCSVGWDGRLRVIEGR